MNQTITHQTVRAVLAHALTLMTLFLVFVAPIAVPVTVDAAPGLTSFVPDECYGKAALDSEGRVSVQCGWNQLMEMGQNIIRNAIYLAAMAAVISLVYVGYLLMTSGDNEGNRKKAKEIGGKVIAGIFYTMAAWLLVATILRFLGVQDAYSLLR
jgi:hypothetical protein